MHITLTADQADLVRAHIREFVSRPPEKLSWLLDEALLRSALPLFLTWTHAFWLSADGELTVWLHDDSFTALGQPEIKPLDYRTALVQGSISFPLLAFLVPPRPLDAEDCDTCHGTGKLSPPIPPQMICKCGGTGWTDRKPKSSAEESTPRRSASEDE